MPYEKPSIKSLIMTVIFPSIWALIIFGLAVDQIAFPTAYHLSIFVLAIIIYAETWFVLRESAAHVLSTYQLFNLAIGFANGTFLFYAGMSVIYILLFCIEFIGSLFNSFGQAMIILFASFLLPFLLVPILSYRSALSLQRKIPIQHKQYIYAGYLGALALQVIFYLFTGAAPLLILVKDILS